MDTEKDTEHCIDGEHSVGRPLAGRQVDASDDLTYTHDSLSGGLEYLRCGWCEIEM